MQRWTITTVCLRFCIRLFHIKRDWFCRLYYYKRLYLKIRKTIFLCSLCQKIHKILKFWNKYLFSTKFIIFFNWRCKLKKKIHFLKRYFIVPIIKLIKKCFIQNLLFFDFFVKYFLENVENRLFLGDEFYFW